MASPQEFHRLVESESPPRGRAVGSRYGAPAKTGPHPLPPPKGKVGSAGPRFSPNVKLDTSQVVDSRFRAVQPWTAPPSRGQQMGTGLGVNEVPRAKKKRK